MATASETIQGLIQNFDRFEGELKETLKRQDDEIRNHGESTSETAKKVAELGGALEQIQNDLREAKEHLRELETRAARPNFGASTRQSIGSAFVDSDQYKNMVAQNSATSDRFEFEGSLLSQPVNIDSGSASAGALIEPHRDNEIVRILQEAPTLRNLLPVRPIGTNSVEWVEQTGFVNAAAPVAEGTYAEPATKPASNISYALRSAPVQTIAHWMPSTRAVLADALQLRAEIDDSLRVGLRLVEEAQILYGTGVSPNLQGITTHPNVQTYALGDGGEGETKIDAIRRAILKARLAQLQVSGIVLNPNDWADIELTKDDEKRYIWVTVPEGGVMRLWRVPVVESTVIEAGQALVGAFAQGATLWDREQAAIRVSEHHKEMFIQNQVAILAEERVCLAIRRPEAFVVVDFEPDPDE